MAAQYDVEILSFTPVDGGPPQRNSLGVLPLRGAFTWSNELNNSGGFRFEVDGRAVTPELRDRILYPRQRASELVVYRQEGGRTDIVQAGPLRTRSIKATARDSDTTVTITGEGYLSYLKEMTYHNTGQIASPLDQYALMGWLIGLAQTSLFPGGDVAAGFPNFWDMGFVLTGGHASGVMRQPGRKVTEAEAMLVGLPAGAFIEKPLWTQDGEYLFDIITRYSEGERGFDFAAQYSGRGDTVEIVLGDDPTRVGAYLSGIVGANRTLLKGQDKSDSVLFDSSQSLSSWELVSSVAVGSTAAVCLAVGPGRGERLPVIYVDDPTLPTSQQTQFRNPNDPGVGGLVRNEDHDPRIYAHAYDQEAFAALGHRVKVLYFGDVFQGSDTGRYREDDANVGDRIATISEKARGMVEQFRNQYEVLRAEILGTEALPVTAYDVGDTVTYRLDSETMGIYTARGRILKKTVKVNPDGVETVSLELLSATPVGSF